MPVIFHSEGIDYSPPNPLALERWIASEINMRNNSPGDISIIFCSNDYLLEMNRKYLEHDYYTDVITFNYNDGKIISGDVFISYDQVKINSKELSVNFADELNRVIIHGVLHLLGYDDNTESALSKMREEEDLALDRLEGDER